MCAAIADNSNHHFSLYATNIISHRSFFFIDRFPSSSSSGAHQRRDQGASTTSITDQNRHQPWVAEVAKGNEIIDHPRLRPPVPVHCAVSPRTVCASHHPAVPETPFFGFWFAIYKWSGLTLAEDKTRLCSGHPLRWLFRAIGLHFTLLSHAYSCISLHIHTDTARVAQALFHVHYAGPLPSSRSGPCTCLDCLILSYLNNLITWIDQSSAFPCFHLH